MFLKPATWSSQSNQPYKTASQTSQHKQPTANSFQPISKHGLSLYSWKELKKGGKKTLYCTYYGVLQRKFNNNPKKDLLSQRLTSSLRLLSSSFSLTPNSLTRHFHFHFHSSFFNTLKHSQTYQSTPKSQNPRREKTNHQSTTINHRQM